MRVSPVEKFLGLDALHRGPLGLLGLTPENCTDERIVSSLEWQLDRVAQHPEGDTPAADEARLALHAAAAQLLDRNVRRLVLARVESGEVGRPGNDSPPGTASDESLEQDALRTLAMHGGWNKKSIARLTAIAHQRGMTSQDLAQSLATLSSKPRRPGSQRSRDTAPTDSRSHTTRDPAGQVPRAPVQQARVTTSATGGDSALQPASGEPRPYVIDRGNIHLRNLVIGVGVATLLFIGLLVFLAVLITSPGNSPAGGSAGAPVAGNTPGSSNTPKAIASSSNGSTNATSDATATPGNSPKKNPNGDAAATRAGERSPARNEKDSGYVDPVLVVHSLRDSVTLFKTDSAKALSMFESGVASLSRRWCRFDPAQRRAADAAVIDFVYASASISQASASAMNIVTREALLLAGTQSAPPSEDSPSVEPPPSKVTRDKVWPLVWSVGILTRLSRERELPSDISAAVESALTSAIGADRPRIDVTFETGAVAALRRVPALLIRQLTSAAQATGTRAADEKQGTAPSSVQATSDQPMSEWIEAAAALSGPDLDQYERLLADGLEQLLTTCAEPTDDRNVFAAVQQIAGTLRWRKDGPARVKLMQWFKDQRFTLKDLQVLTSAIVSRSVAEGVDATMVLSSGASTGDRERVRALFAKSWGESGKVGSAKSSAPWANASRAEIRRLGDLSSSLDLLEATVRLSELSEAAMLLWKGDSDAAARIVENAGISADSAKKPAATPTTRFTLDTNSEGDGRWVASYLSAGRNILLRLERLKELEDSGNAIGPADAELLVDLAYNESPAEVRAAAQRVILKYASEPVIVNGLLEGLPRAPKYVTVSTMIENVLSVKLPKATDPAWELETRRALVERLLELLASAGDQSSINDLSALLFESYRVRSGLDAHKPDQVATNSDAQRGSEAAAAMWQLWRRAAEAASPNEYAPLSLDAIDRRHEGRVSLASGPIQRFAADQAGTAELIAYVLTSERPAAVGDARVVLADMAADRRKASHVFGQLAATERAILRLWLLRFQEADQ